MPETYRNDRYIQQTRTSWLPIDCLAVSAYRLPFVCVWVAKDVIASWRHLYNSTKNINNVYQTTHILVKW